MARERMVTRTVEKAEVDFMVVNVLTSEVSAETVSISATIKREDALKYARKHLKIENCEFVAVKDYRVSEVLYGMPEQQFIEMAKILPPRSKQETGE